MGHENVFSGESMRQQEEIDPKNINRSVYAYDDNDIHITLFWYIKNRIQMNFLMVDNDVVHLESAEQLSCSPYKKIVGLGKTFC